MNGLRQAAYAEEVSRLNIDSSRNYIQSGFMASSGSNPDIVRSTVESGGGGFITFYRRISDQILLGLGHDVFSVSTHATSDNCVGDLSTANCISTNHAIRVQSLEFSTIFYFKDMGYKNWGFYLSPAVGYSNVKMTGSFDR